MSKCKACGFEYIPTHRITLCPSCRTINDFPDYTPIIKIDAEIIEEVEVSAILGTSRDSTELQTSAS